MRSPYAPIKNPRTVFSRSCFVFTHKSALISVQICELDHMRRVWRFVHPNTHSRISARMNCMYGDMYGLSLDLEERYIP